MESYILYNVYFNIPISEKEEEIKFTKFYCLNKFLVRNQKNYVF